ncbi:hypothetical protein [Bradyrhizobium sp.]|uniref:hypothetical protein n=1 Tax=Bradyrhizobium sp. TaxID=376 RepID=UPI003BB1C0F7
MTKWIGGVALAAFIVIFGGHLGGCFTTKAQAAVQKLQTQVATDLSARRWYRHYHHYRHAYWPYHYYRPYHYYYAPPYSYWNGPFFPFPGFGWDPYPYW